MGQARAPQMPQKTRPMLWDLCTHASQYLELGREPPKLFLSVGAALQGGGSWSQNWVELATLALLAAREDQKVGQRRRGATTSEETNQIITACNAPCAWLHSAARCSSGAPKNWGGATCRAEKNLTAECDHLKVPMIVDFGGEPPGFPVPQLQLPSSPVPQLSCSQPGRLRRRAARRARQISL